MNDPCAPLIPHQSYAAVFLRFLKFGLLAWGGPVAQIAMIRRELVEEERWISGERFNRALAVYQVLPGPEAHELCVYFGMLARGRLVIHDQTAKHHAAFSSPAPSGMRKTTRVPPAWRSKSSSDARPP